ncbi:MAG TPA: V-type ATP synthase subunit E [Spirochaetia bacterium]|nr:V-type ATP synthase subunit E [Spirochaetia bacterium]
MGDERDRAAPADPDPGPDAPADRAPRPLVEAIDSRAAEERARILAEAQARAAEIAAAAEAECERLQAQAFAALERELELAQVRFLGEARLGARTDGLGRRRALVAEVFRRAEQRIHELENGPGAAAALARLAEEARAAAGEPCVVHASGSDWSVTAESVDGRRRVDNSPAARLARARETAEHEAARLLFGASGGPPANEQGPP